MSKYLKIYEKLCPDDPIAKDDPRRSTIIAEMQAVHRAANDEAAVEVIEWWNAWPNPQHLSAMEFVKEARQLLL